MSLSSRRSAFDVVIVGGGIVGLATAYQILSANPRVHLLLLEKEAHVAAHQTSHNSGVIHSGIYYKPGSLKAQNCVSGYHQMLAFCRAEEIPFELCGKVVVATTTDEIPRLMDLKSRGEANGLGGQGGIRELSAEELQDYEPNCTGVRALHVPQTGIVDYSQVAAALRKRIEALGGGVILQSRVIRIQTKEHVEVVYRCSNANPISEQSSSQSSERSIVTKQLVNCGGLHSDRIAQMTESTVDVRIIPFRGEYYTLKKERSDLVKNLIYPVPDPAFPFLGVHFTRMIAGGVELGPNAVLALKREGYKKTDINLRDFIQTASWPGLHKVVGRYWREGMYELYRSLSKKAFWRAAQKLVPSVALEDLAPGGAGVRAQACHRDGRLLDDFMIVERERLIHVLNAPSPAATSSLSIGKTIANIVARKL